MACGRAVGALVLAAACLGPAALDAQQRSCRPELVRAGSASRRVVGEGRVHQFLGGRALFICIGRSDSLLADSVAWYSELDRMDFIGNVRMSDSTMRLAADRARYFPGDERIDALGNVRLVNRSTGSVLEGPELTYWREAPGVRDTAEMYAIRRPRVEYRETPDTSLTPYVIIGERVRMKGDRQAWASGGVTIEREDFHATADSAALDLESGAGVLVQRAVAQSRDSAAYRIEGGSIAFRLYDDRLTWVQARGQARALSEDWAVTGDTIEFDVTDDLIQGGRVWADSAGALAVSETQRISADSLAFDAPGQVLDEIRGFGSARALTEPDSLQPEPDWIAGDTLVARFEDQPSGGRGLAMLEARGNARAYYHIYEDGDRRLEPAINYAVAERITARFVDEELDRVDFVNQAHGVYAEPLRRP